MTTCFHNLEVVMSLLSPVGYAGVAKIVKRKVFYTGLLYSTLKVISEFTILNRFIVVGKDIIMVQMSYTTSENVRQVGNGNLFALSPLPSSILYPIKVVAPHQKLLIA